MSAPGRTVQAGQALGRLTAFSVGYALLQLFGGPLAFPAASHLASWPSSGLALAILGRVSLRWWPAYLAVQAGVDIAIGHSRHLDVTLVLGYAVAGGLQTWLGALLLRRLVGHRMPTGSPGWVLRGLIPIALVSSAVGAGVVAVVAAAHRHSAAVLVATWWPTASSAAFGTVMLVPAVEAVRAWAVRRRVPTRVEAIEGSLVVSAQVLLLIGALGPLGGKTPVQHAFMLLPPVFWAVVRLGPRWTAVHLLGLNTAVVAATALGRGPFAAALVVSEQMAEVQVFGASSIVVCLVMAEIVDQRERAESGAQSRAQALENAVEGIAFLSPEGIVLRVNAAYAALLGTQPQELLGSTWLDTMHPADRGSAERLLVDPSTGRTGLTLRGRRRDGTIVRHHVTAIAERDELGRVSGVHCFARDVTVRNATVDPLEQLFRLSPQLLCLLDTQGRFRRLNPAWTLNLGHPLEDLLGTHIVELAHPDDLQSTLFEVNRILAGAESASFQNRFRAADGTYRWLHWNLAVDAERSVVYAVAHDMTATKITEHTLAHARDQALEASRLKSQFLATMSHEIRTPMNGVIGLSDLLDQTVLNGEQRGYVDGIRTAGTALLGVINDILDFSKIESGRFVLEEIDFDIAGVVQDVVGLAGQSARAKGLAVEVDIDPDLPTDLRGDPARIRQVVLNLVSNAIKFTAEGGVTIRLDLVEPDEAGLPAVLSPDDGSEPPLAVRLEVRDTGVGMDADTIAKLFEPFTQADASTTRMYGGTGLGLAVSRQLIEAMGGWISVQSERGFGAAFRATVPLARAVGGDDADGSEPLRPRVLVVDDDEAESKLLADQLRAGGFRVATAPDLPSTLGLLREQSSRGRPFRVVVLAKAPTEAGTDADRAAVLDLADELATHPGSPAVPVVLIGDGATIAPGRAHQSRVHATVPRPPLAAELQQAVRGAVEAAASDSSVDIERGRILLVEDNDINQAVAVGVLNRLGYTVDVAEDGVEALEMVGAWPYQAILMDCQMPRMDGYTATAELRARPDLAHIPIIAMTANAMKEDRDRCLQAGMDDYMSKPIRAADLDATLLRWIGVDRRSPNAGPDAGPDSGPDAGPNAGSGVPAPRRSPVEERLVELSGDRSPEEVELVRSIALSFLGRVPDLLSRLDEALTGADAEDGHRLAHSLKGAAANMGADAVASVCQQIEDLAEQGRHRDALEHRAELTELLAQTCDEIGRYLAESTPAP